MKLKVSLAKIKMLESGIVPAMNGTELKNMLNSLPPEERVAAKRKFRKMWRKLRRANPDLSLMMGSEKNHNPTEDEKRNRSVLVTSRIVEKVKE